MCLKACSGIYCSVLDIYSNNLFIYSYQFGVRFVKNNSGHGKHTQMKTLPTSKSTIKSNVNTSPSTFTSLSPLKHQQHLPNTLLLTSKSYQYKYQYQHMKHEHEHEHQHHHNQLLLRHVSFMWAPAWWSITCDINTFENDKLQSFQYRWFIQYS